MYERPRLDRLSHPPSDHPMGKAGDVLAVRLEVAGVPCMGLNGGPLIGHTETDRPRSAILGHGGQASACGCCKGPWGRSEQIALRADRV